MSLCASGPSRICAQFLNGKCNGACNSLHQQSKFNWQMEDGDDRWADILYEKEIEMAFCNPASDNIDLQTPVSLNGIVIKVNILASFSDFTCTVVKQDGTLLHGKVRRLSTPSYVDDDSVKIPGSTDCVVASQSAFTVWTWYWSDGGVWKRFEIDSPAPWQSVLESKYLAGQEVFRFEVKTPQSSVPAVMLIDFNAMHLVSLLDNSKWSIKRRPAYDIAPYPIRPIPYNTDVPENWKPIDTQHEFELVALNPDSMEYHLVTSEFRRTTDHSIKDVFRLQNIHLWHKFHSKKMYMKSKGRDPNERQLFHGTSRSDVVQSIFTQNFDWRCAGKNATAFGKGSYFASDASYSDKYTGSDRRGSDSKHWMFMARVLLGDYTQGHCDYVRPPPKDGNAPYGELYDSCVNRQPQPFIFVIFDHDQCYPEYVICYEKKN